MGPRNRIGYLGAINCEYISADYRIWLSGLIASGVGDLGWGNGPMG